MMPLSKLVRCLFIGAVFALIASSAPAQSAEELERRLIGEWEGMDDGEKTTMIFAANSKFTVIKGSEGILKGQYTVDFTVKPAPLTLVAGGTVGKTIVEFLSADKIRIEEADEPDAPRPKSFKNFVVLTRQ